MANKKGLIAALAAGVTIAGATVAALRRTHRLQEEARAAGAHVPYGPYEAVVKRPLDASIASGLVIALSPIMFATYIAVRLKLGSPAIFRQVRPGMIDSATCQERLFELYKFRTMTDKRDPKTGELLPDDERLTTLGKVLRSTSLDELPELYNILKGDMALIGPRPLLVRYLPYYTKEERRRHEVRVGLTGLAQVRGRNYSSWQERFHYDLLYVDKVTFLGDIRILIDSLRVVLSRSGVADRSQIKEGEDGELYITINGVKRRYPKPLDKERMRANE